MNNPKLKLLLDQLNELESSLPKSESLSLLDQLVGEKTQGLTDKLKEDVSLKGMESINNKLDKFKQDFDLAPVLEEIDAFHAKLEEAKAEIQKQSDSQTQLTDTKLQAVNQVIADLQKTIDKEVNDKASSLLSNFTALRNEFTVTGEIRKQQDRNSNLTISEIQKAIKDLGISLQDEGTKSATSLKDSTTTLTTDFDTKIEKFKKDVTKRFQQLGGGSMNRKITFNGTDKLTRYTDINWKAGANVTFTISNNNTTKMVDVTVAATGGSGSGIVRSIQSISASQAADSNATTDYVYLCSGTMTLTMPDATTNTNLYTIKNVGAGTITVNTTSAQTIDGSSSITLPVRYTSVDLVSDTAGWNVT